MKRVGLGGGVKCGLVKTENMEAKFSQWLSWGGANPLCLELSTLGIRELCFYARHLLSIMMSSSGPYHLPAGGGGLAD